MRRSAALAHARRALAEVRAATDEDDALHPDPGPR